MKLPAPLAALGSDDCLYLAQDNYARTGSHWLAVLSAGSLVATAQKLLETGYHLEDICGLNALEVAVSVYHFAHFSIPGRISLLVTAPYGSVSFPSIASVYHGAEWHERETRDFFGFTYVGNPNFVPLLLPRQMIAEHPLEKSEENRAPFHVLFNAAERGATVLRKAESFTLLDTPVSTDTATRATAEDS